MLLLIIYTQNKVACLECSNRLLRKFANTPVNNFFMNNEPRNISVCVYISQINDLFSKGVLQFNSDRLAEA